MGHNCELNIVCDIVRAASSLMEVYYSLKFTITL